MLVDADVANTRTHMRLTTFYAQGQVDQIVHNRHAANSVSMFAACAVDSFVGQW